MQSPDRSSEVLLIRDQLKVLTEAFDLALKKNLQIGDIKKIYHEMHLMQNKLDEILSDILVNAKKNKTC